MSTSSARIVAFIAGLLLALYEGARPLLEGDTPSGRDAYLMALGVAAMAYVTKYHRDASPKQVETATARARVDAAQAAYDAGVRDSVRPPVAWTEVVGLDLPDEVTPLERGKGGAQ